MLTSLFSVPINLLQEVGLHLPLVVSCLALGGNLYLGVHFLSHRIGGGLLDFYSFLLLGWQTAKIVAHCTLLLPMIPAVRTQIGSSIEPVLDIIIIVSYVSELVFVLALAPLLSSCFAFAFAIGDPVIDSNLKVSSPS